jgi:hypothetical protein
VGRRSNRKLGWTVLAAVALVVAVADAATLNKRARLREGPSKDTRLLGWLEEGTAVALEGERSGWYAVRAPDGQTGFIWQEHLRFAAGEGAPALPASTTTVPAAVPTTLPVPAAPTATVPPETRPVHEARPASADRPDAGVASEIERLRSEVARLASAHEELTQRLGRSGAPPPMGTDGSAGAAVLFFGIGAVFGWLFGRFASSRRERRSRLRL